MPAETQSWSGGCPCHEVLDYWEPRHQAEELPGMTNTQSLPSLS